MNKLYFIFIPFMVLLLGCATQVQPKREDFPLWVLNPIVPGYLAVVGAAPVQNKNNKKWQLLAAELDAHKKAIDDNQEEKTAMIKQIKKQREYINISDNQSRSLESKFIEIKQDLQKYKSKTETYEQINKR